MKVFLLCSGLGRIRRGYESFTQECFDALNTIPELDVHLFKGAGIDGPKSKVLRNISRISSWGLRLGRWTRRGSYFIEQFTFFVSLVPYLQKERPQIVYFSDGNLGNFLWYWRKVTRQQYRLLFSNGGPLTPPFPRWDYIQQIVPKYLDEAIDAGEPPNRQCLVSYGFNISQMARHQPVYAEKELRLRLGLPENRKILLSVGAINATHKRMDYVIRELASLPVPRPFLVVLGQRDAESPAIGELALRLLGDDGYRFSMVDHRETIAYYKAADFFTLASLNEGFGRVYVEAMTEGLMCLTHDYDVARYILGEWGKFADFSKAGGLSSLLIKQLAVGEDCDKRNARCDYVFNRFGWDVLRPQYLKMLMQCVSIDVKAS